MAGYVSEAVIRRLPGYYRHLRELEAEGVRQISSQGLGERMKLTASQIRRTSTASAASAVRGTDTACRNCENISE
jgi:NADH/NAD ratio-sensing transcriptional regulator Rex